MFSYQKNKPCFHKSNRYNHCTGLNYNFLNYYILYFCYSIQHLIISNYYFISLRLHFVLLYTDCNYSFGFLHQDERKRSSNESINDEEEHKEVQKTPRKSPRKESRSSRHGIKKILPFVVLIVMNLIYVCCILYVDYKYFYYAKRI